MTGAIKEKVLEKLRERQADASESATADAVDRAEAHFLEQTHRNTVPERAFWLWVEIAQAYLHQDIAGAGQQISSIKRGDTTVQYQDGEGGSLGSFVNRLAAYRVGTIR